MRNVFQESQKALLPLPPKNDNEAETLLTCDFPEGLLNFDGQEFVFPKGFHVEASSRWLEDSILVVNIGISALIQAECARCLAPASLEISGDLGYLYCSRNAEELDGFDEYMPVEVEFFGRVIDVMPQIRESIYTLMPTKILCREDCKGLCPVCGMNLNEGSCSCDSENVDPRLEALRNFKFTAE
ncbi:MAG: DUF177 domain-containing protein [Synergistaceae bacterium]|nr:DUF177 domain-containing protein [Synergistaceae bacterium]